MAELDLPILPHKAELALRAVRDNRVGTIADLGACWAVNGGYVFFLLDNSNIAHAYIVDHRITNLTTQRIQKYGDRASIVGNCLINDALVIRDFPHVDALIMYDILLHQVNLDWNDFLSEWGKRANVIIIYNQMWTLHEHTVRFVDFGHDWYKKHVLYTSNERLDDWFNNFDQ